MALRTLILAFAFTAAAAANGLAAGQLTAVESKHSVADAAGRLVKALEAKGIKVAAQIDHAAAAQAVGLDMPPAIVVMFGNPKLGTPLMLADPEIAIDLPMRMLIWQGADGKVRVGYADPAKIKERYALDGREDIVKTMSGALAAFAKAAADGP
jgi:uncharacterized protein (DUF302 family)